MLSAILILIGVTAFLIGEPVCKKRWSISFAFITSGLSGAALCFCFVLVDILDKPLIKNYLIQPFLWLGMNPLFIFVAMIAFDNLLMNNIKFDYHGRTINVWSFIENQMFNSWINQAYVSSLIVSLLNLALWLGVACVLFKKKIFIKL
jgi:predicted acyltransferase